MSSATKCLRSVAGRCVSGGSAALGQPAGQGLVQGGRRDGLGEVVVHAGLEAALTVFGKGVGGERQDGPGGVAGQGADGDGGVEATHHGHAEVHQDQVEIGLRGHRDGLLAVLGDGHLEAGALQQFPGDLLVEEVVLGQQDVAPGVGGELRAGV